MTGLGEEQPDEPPTSGLRPEPSTEKKASKEGASGKEDVDGKILSAEESLRGTRHFDREKSWPDELRPKKKGEEQPRKFKILNNFILANIK